MVNALAYFFYCPVICALKIFDAILLSFQPHPSSLVRLQMSSWGLYIQRNVKKNRMLIFCHIRKNGYVIYG